MSRKASLENGKLRWWTYGARFFLSLSIGFSLYISSSFLAQFLDEDYVGIVFVIAALIAIFILFRMPFFLSQYGNVRIMATLGFIAILIIPLLVTAGSATLVVSLFILFYVINLILRYGLDLYLEHLSTDEETGEIRGIFTVLTHGPLIFAVLATSFILDKTTDYWKVFAVGALALLPFVMIASNKLKEDKEKYKTIPAFNTLKKIILAKDTHDKKLHQILAIDFLLNFFYVVMIIYTPIYLHNYIGLNWSEIGLIFALMTLPFIILPIPLGSLADKKIGEKELLTLGLLITGVATFAMSFITTPSFWLWAGILVLTRIGASIVESMKETYLFKTISAGDVGVLSISRDTIALAYITGPLFTSAFLTFYDFKFLFAFLGLVMIFGLRYSLTLRDTL